MKLIKVKSDAVNMQLSESVIRDAILRLQNRLQDIEGSLTVAIRNIENQKNVPAEFDVRKIHDKLTRTRRSVQNSLKELMK